MRLYMQLVSCLTLVISSSLATHAPAQGAGQAVLPVVGSSHSGGSKILPSSHIEGIVPKSARNSFGKVNSAIPLAWTPTKFQQVFDGAELPTTRSIAYIAAAKDTLLS